MNARTSTLASLVLFLVIPACSTAPDDGSSDDATDTTSADLSVCKTSQCGPALEMPTLICPDGSLGGNTGRCIRTKGTTCHWEIRQCPPAPTPVPPVPPKLDCSAPGACGPALGMPNYLCD